MCGRPLSRVFPHLLALRLHEASSRRSTRYYRPEAHTIRYFAFGLIFPAEAESSTFQSGSMTALTASVSLYPSILPGIAYLPLSL